jgi:hypothetical protein
MLRKPAWPGLHLRHVEKGALEFPFFCIAWLEKSFWDSFLSEREAGAFWALN